MKASVREVLEGKRRSMTVYHEGFKPYVSPYTAERERKRKKRLRQNAKPGAKLLYCTCACGHSFITVSANVKWCADCRKSGVNRGDASRRKLAQRQRRARQYFAVGHHSEIDWRNKLKEQGYCCFYCAKELTARTWTRDHVVPLSKGGSENIENIVAACRSCNSSKGTLSLTQFIEKQRKKTVVEAGQTAAC